MQGDVTIAKNYLQAEEITELNRIVVMFLDFAEDQARAASRFFFTTGKSGLTSFCDSMSGAFFLMRGRCRANKPMRKRN